MLLQQLILIKSLCILWKKYSSHTQHTVKPRISAHTAFTPTMHARTTNSKKHTLGSVHKYFGGGGGWAIENFCRQTFLTPLCKPPKLFEPPPSTSVKTF